MNQKKTKSEIVEHQQAVITHVLYWGLLLLGVILGYRYLLPVLMPFVIALLLSWAMNRPVTWFHRKTRLPRAIPAVFLLLMLAGVAVGLCALVGTGLFSTIQNLADKIPAFFDHGILPALDYFFTWIEDVVGSIDPASGAALSSAIDSLFSFLSRSVLQMCTNLVAGLGGVIASLPSLFIKTIITLIVTIFISCDFNNVRRFLLRLVPKKFDQISHEFGSFFRKTVAKCLVAYVLIFSITFLELLLGFKLLLGINGASTLAFFVALLDILPVLGTGTVLIPWAVISLIQGHIAYGVKLLVLYLVITVVRQMMEPRLVGHQMQLHPVLTFAAMLVGVRFFGFLGLFGLPLLLAFLRQLHEKGIIRLSILADDPPAPQPDSQEPPAREEKA